MQARFRLSITLLLISSSALLGNSGRSPFSTKLGGDAKTLHALDRLTFGPTEVERERIKKMGLKKWLDAQLHPETISENPVLAQKLQPLDSLAMPAGEMLRRYPSPQMVVAYASGKLELPDDPELKQRLAVLAERYKKKLDKKGLDGSLLKNGNEMTSEAVRKRAAGMSREEMADVAPAQVVLRDLSAGKLLRAVYSDRQLEEVLVDFWFNHFNVFANKGAGKFLTTSYEREAIRPHVLGRFRDLLGATAHSPAMLFYLDNWQSVSPDAPRFAKRQAMMSQPGKAKKRGLNENYARELLELQTLGVSGGYTQDDIINVARCFTGWTIRQPYTKPDFVFNSRVHDGAEKFVLGNKIRPGGGADDGEQVLDILAKHPSTALFLSRKLAQRFVADEPPEALVKSMASTFTKSGGDLRAVMETMLKSAEFWSEGARKQKVKSPLEMVASALRATGADVTDAVPAVQRIAALGQPLYQKVEPTGYSNNSGEWVNSAALLARMNFASALTKNQIAGIRLPEDRWSAEPFAIAAGLLMAEPNEQTRRALQRGLEQKQDAATMAGLVLGSPEFQRR